MSYNNNANANANTNLWITKYAPKSFDSFVLNKKIAEKYKNTLYNQNYFNTILYGKNGIGKYTIAMCILRELYGDKIYYKYKTKLTLGNGKNVEIISSNYHYEINCNNSNNLVFNENSISVSFFLIF